MFRVVKKFRGFLNRKQKLQIAMITIMMVIGGLLETLGVAMILPLMTTVMTPDFFYQSGKARWISHFFHIESQTGFVIFILLGLILIFFVKNAFLFLEYYVQICFVCDNRVATQQQMIEAYLNRPYEYYLSANSGEIIRVITSDIGGVFHTLQMVLTFFTELIVSIMLLIAVVAVDYLMAGIIIIVLSVEMFLIYRIIKPILKKSGIDVMNMTAQANKWTLQAISGVKEIKVAQKEAFFVKQYGHYAGEAVKIEKKKSTLDNLPRVMIETVTTAAMLMAMIVMLLLGRTIGELLPQLSAFVFAAVRLLPSANRMSSDINTIAFMEPVLDQTISNLNAAFDAVPAEQEKMSGGTQLSLQKCCELRKISFRYPNSERKILDEADMVVPAGKSIGIVGVSGAGKTTAVDIMLGLLHQQSGTVLTDGKDVRANYGMWLSMLSYIPQTIFLLNDTVRANVAFGLPPEEIDDEKVWRVLEEAQMKEFVSGLPNGLNTSIGERGVRLSGGQRQRIGIARALYSDPELLVFDEATSSLDNETEAAVMQSIHALHGKKTMIIIAHRLSTIEDCDILYEVKDRKMYQRERD